MVQAKFGEEEYSLVHSGIFGPDWQRDPQNFKIWSKLPFCSGFFCPTEATLYTDQGEIYAVFRCYRNEAAIQMIVGMIAGSLIGFEKFL